MPKSSVIVPVYNVKDYLEKCVASVLAQTERNFELLLIDDGSTDGSGALCDTLAQRDGRIRVIHQENRGLGGARNTGIQAAEGDWLLFVDSDDWIEPELLEKTLAAGESSEAEIVYFSLRSVDLGGKELSVLKDSLPIGTSFTAKTRKDVFLSYPCACNKLFSRELFLRTGVLFPPRVWYEDVRTTVKLVAEANSLIAIDYVGYNYLQRPGSIIQSVNLERNIEIVDAFDDILAYFREQGLFEEYRDELCFMTLFHVYLTASVRVIRLDRHSDLLPKFAAYLRENFPDYRQNKYRATLTRNQKIILSLLEKKLTLLIALIFKIK